MPILRVTPGLRAFFERLGLWADGRPAGALVAMLGARMQHLETPAYMAFAISSEQMAALFLHASLARCSGVSIHSRAHCVRRLREEAARAGIDLLAALRRVPDLSEEAEFVVRWEAERVSNLAGGAQATPAVTASPPPPAASTGAAWKSLYVHLGGTLLSIYTTRGMWAGGQPQGRLQAMLGEPLRWLDSPTGRAFAVSPEQLAALYADISSLPDAAIDGRARGQFLRRLRERAAACGLVLQASPAAQAHPAGGHAAELQPGGVVAPHASGAAVACRPMPPAAVPFTWLQRPEHGKAKTLFEQHCMKTIRDFIDYTQSSAYAQGGSHE